MVCWVATGLASRVRRPTVRQYELSLTRYTTALLRAMAEKLIPGIPHATRIAILQQTDEDDGPGGNASLKLGMSVLESVLSSDEARNEAVRMADCEYPTPVIIVHSG